ncbi:MAG: nucleoside deaminase [Crocinitomicaceae bacterium]|nr:nucleoside deaminase [Crocinitomicaceae bacterium]MBK8927838.1 nucleoside deaminase [Crocinitomicaceae bacterium]
MHDQPLDPFNDEYFMRQALRQAEMAFDADEVPVGAVIVLEKRIIARAHNLTEKLHDVTAHAEMQAITAAAEFLGAKYLNKCTLYVTLEPCVMCAGALAWSQIDRIVYGAKDEKRGVSKLSKEILHPKTVIEGGLFASESTKLLQEFFGRKRLQG